MTTDEAGTTSAPRLARVWPWLVTAARITAATGILLGVAYGLSLRVSGANLDHLLADLRAGRVTELSYGSESEFTAPPLGPYWLYDDETRVWWRTTDGTRHTFLTSEQDVSPADEGLATEESSTTEIVLRDGQDRVLNLIAAELERNPTPNDLPLHAHPVPRWLELWVVGGLAVVFATLVAGPQPRLATRWAWFWMLAVPLGLGILALLAVEAPWSRRAWAMPVPLPHRQQKGEPGGDGRLTGGRAFLIAMVLAPVALALTIFPLLEWLGVDAGW